MNVLIQPALARKIRNLKQRPGKLVARVIRIQSQSSVDGQSLPDLLRYHTNQDPQGRKAASSALGADIVHPILLKRFRRAAQDAGFDPKLLVLTGYRGQVDPSMPVALQELKPMAISHAVVTVGKVVIDLCHKRMGEKYGLPPTYQISRVLERWQHIQDVSKFAELTPEDVKRMHSLEMQDRETAGYNAEHRRPPDTRMDQGLQFIPV